MAKVLDNVLVRDPGTNAVVFLAAGEEIPPALKDQIGEHLVVRPSRAVPEKTEG
ncbi:MAG: hypothetical protein KBF43_05435 [Dermatophilaceae bacterium]|jgi:hypothetical protein|nr:hypothetical protein [Dermatophilaceae bacterium]